MPHSLLSRPSESEYAPFYAGYVGRIGDGVMERLQQQANALEPLRALGEDDANRGYAAGKWTVKEVVGHITDAERIFAYRLLRIARGDMTPLPGFDENTYVATANFGRYPLGRLLDNFGATRAATLAMMTELDGDAWTRKGVASGFPVSARAIAYIIAGHFSHHASLLRDRYGLDAVTES